jgi:hypothetical protein
VFVALNVASLRGKPTTRPFREDECPYPRAWRKTGAHSGKGCGARGFRRICLPSALGIAGLTEAWRAAGSLLGTPQAVPDALSILDAALWR